MNSVDRIFSLMYRRIKFGVTMQSAFRRVHLYGIAVRILEHVVPDIRQHDSLPRFNIVVCANTSAGKSTLVNALLGKDLLPALNEATTAKVISIYDRDGLSRVLGCCVSKNDVASVTCCDDVNIMRIADWNSNDCVQRIYLQSDLNGICNGTRVVVVHDTPGTNSSQNPHHREVTMGFLSKGNLDALLYVVNFENMMSDDQDVLLKDIASLKEVRDQMPVVFAINKLDSVDPSKEDASKSISRFEQHVEKIGFKNYFIMPVAAKAGRLLKMSLLGLSGDFSENESDDFQIIFRKFFKRTDVRRYWPQISLHSKDGSGTYGCSFDRIFVSGVEYRVDQLSVALENTGIPALEKMLESLCSKLNQNKESNHGGNQS